ncbi:acyl-CoA dehydrogenase family protein [Variovorax sp. J22P271]|uniref:acyl-CoA dehydrogenase family protein n=1 Tax=Variovorax davisae TaxID=3053515 RepID=UPI0025783A19|nr:acyl-CoA dehydrogenase family protein [Variovorax sp. J22P271]MDM0032464.1 acyl-CoA dehydrogenase family protein [Variovorax sp. J22P271]
MQLDINPDLAEMRPTVRRFVTEQLEPMALQIDALGEVPAQVLGALQAQGYLGMRLPANLGGAEADLSTYCLVMEELGRSHRVFTLMLDASSGLTPIAIARFGTEEQKARYVPGLADGSQRASFGLTEPDAGSDAAALRTRAKKVEGGWSISGMKHYISGAHRADVVMVLAVTDPALKARGGITAFLVDRGTPGMEITRTDKTIGSDPIQISEIRFEDCVVGDAAVLGAVGQGFAIAMGSLVSGRMGVSAACIGTADRLLEIAIDYAKTRTTFGQPLSERQAIQWMLADSATELALARSLAYETLRRIDAGEDTGSAPSMVKLFCSEMVGRIADRAVQILGGAGLIRGVHVERFYRDVRHYRIGEGSSEIQRMLIARDILR